METTRPPLQNSIHRTPQPSPSPSLSLSETTSRKRRRTRPDSDPAPASDSNADNQDSPPQRSHSHRSRWRRDSEDSDDGRRRKRSSLKKITDDGVAEYLAKKAQKKVPLVGATIYWTAAAAIAVSYSPPGCYYWTAAGRLAMRMKARYRWHDIIATDKQ
ncbi:hypothetical protein RHSIM_RhsimUnG0101900 [Rhododendron simsii]|uniref:Uncharacterized protein n=1 Tax=Rhododendron simsii TaxID=118357 RepID=A0A834L534_RHOSS|nr:hypothetical protein RHSIM_RhsimUnG0101900 [Rhododendron simsii]